MTTRYTFQDFQEGRRRVDGSVPDQSPHPYFILLFYYILFIFTLFHNIYFKRYHNVAGDKGEGEVRNNKRIVCLFCLWSDRVYCTVRA